MSSKYTYPEESIMWRLRQADVANGSGQIGIVTDSDNDGELDAIDETLTAGILIDYIGTRTLLDATSASIMTTVPDLPTYLHSALVDFVLAKLHMTEASKKQGNEKYADMNISKMYKAEYYNKIKKNKGGKVKTKGLIMPSPLSLR